MQEMGILLWWDGIFEIDRCGRPAGNVTMILRELFVALPKPPNAGEAAVQEIE
jgi:hypothetical protein